MADAGLHAHTPTSVEETPRRRKVRKGTQSCWECKRRKIRCTFTAPRDTTCNECKRRGTHCVGQEHPDTSTSGSTRHYADRLCRVEGLVEQLVKNADACIHSGHTKSSPQHVQDFQDRLRSPTSNGYSKEDSSIPVSSTVHASRSTVKPIQETVCHLHSGKLGMTQNSLKIASTSTQTALTPNAPLSSQYEEACSKLVAAWPNERDLEIILSVPADTTQCLHGLICSLPAASQGRKTSSLREILQLPGLDSHPVLIARKLLILGSYLQAFSPSSIRRLTNLGVPYHDIMSHSIDTARALVHCNDEFVGSIESIECIMVESMYHNHAGNLRRAWLSIRRALTIAQIMGLNRAGNPPSVKTLEPHTSVSPEHVWFRLIQFDRYLALMLGLPQYVSERVFSTPDALKACTPSERLQRIDCDAAVLILGRNEADIDNIAATQEIDKLLRKAAASMPSQWWLIPTLAPGVGDKIESSPGIGRLYDQLAHYHTVARLHLPYLLRYSATGKYDYSKITVINASREILARYVAFRSSNPTQSYCRGLDSLMFLACTTLCLAHMNAHRQSYLQAGGPEECSAFGFLAHQRPADRGMMERALESIQQMARDGDDLIASRITTVVQHLLEIEGDSADGGSYSAGASTSYGEELECGGRLSDEGNVLHIHVPSFGTIKIERSGTIRSDLNTFPLNEDQNELFVSSLDFDAEDWALQGVDMALFDSLIRGSDLDADMS